MKIATLKEWHPIGHPVKFTSYGASIAGGWTEVSVGDIGVVIDYVPANSNFGCRLLVDWGNDKVYPVFATQIELVK